LTEQSHEDDVPVLHVRATNVVAYQSKPGVTAAPAAGKTIGATPVTIL